MNTIRNAISLVRVGLKEANADSRLPNKYIWNKIVPKTSLILQRESDALRLSNAWDIIQSINCMEVETIPAIDPCCKISTKCKLYRTVEKLPFLYFDQSGPMIRGIKSVDKSKKIEVVDIDFIRRWEDDTNSKYDKTIYAYYQDGRIYLTKKVKIFVQGIFQVDMSDLNFCGCKGDKPCKRFLDNVWYVPQKLEDAIISLVVQDLINYKKIPSQQIIDKNEST